MTSWLFGGASSNEDKYGSVASVYSKLHSCPAADVSLQRQLCEELRLRALETRHHEALGKGVHLLMAALDKSAGDLEVQRSVLGALNSMMQCDPHSKDTYIELVNTETFVERAEWVSRVVTLLENADQTVRYRGLLLLQTLVRNGKLPEVQGGVLSSALGPNALFDLLKDPRDAVRSAVLGLLTDLLADNHDLKQMAAFNGAFESIFYIVEDDGMTEGGDTAKKSLLLLATLLRGHAGNKSHFRETQCVAKLAPLLRFDSSDYLVMTDAKINIIVTTLQVISILVEGGSPTTRQNQTILAQSAVLQHVMQLGLSKINAPRVRRQALRTLGHLIRGNAKNRDSVSQATLKPSPAEALEVAALSRLTIIMLRSPDLLEQLCAQFAYECFLHDNVAAQQLLCTTFTAKQTQPPSEERNNSNDNSGIDAASFDVSLLGCRLLEAVFEWRAEKSSSSASRMRCWVACAVLGAVLKNNRACKESCLQMPVVVAGAEAEEEGSLFSQIVDALIYANRSNAENIVKLALLRLLCGWVHQCPAAVRLFTSVPTHVPAVVEVVLSPGTDVQVAGLAALLLCHIFLYCEEENRRASIKNILGHRIGTEKFLAKLYAVRKSEFFVHGELERNDSEEMSELAESMGGTSDAQARVLETRMLAYILYDFDFTVILKRSYEAVRDALHADSSSSSTANAERGSSAGDSDGSASFSQKALLLGYQDVIASQQKKIKELEEQLCAPPQQREKLQRDGPLFGDQLGGTGGGPANDDAFGLLERRDREIAALKEQLRGMSAIEKENAELREQVGRLKQQVEAAATAKKLESPSSSATLLNGTLLREKQEWQKKYIDSRAEVDELRRKVAALAASANNNSHGVSSDGQSMAELEKDNEKLLLLLADQEMQINDLKEKLRGEK